jgi:hypothetical protein
MYPNSCHRHSIRQFLTFGVYRYDFLRCLQMYSLFVLVCASQTCWAYCVYLNEGGWTLLSANKFRVKVLPRFRMGDCDAHVIQEQHGSSIPDSDINLCMGRNMDLCIMDLSGRRPCHESLSAAPFQSWLKTPTSTLLPPQLFLSTPTFILFHQRANLFESPNCSPSERARPLCITADTKHILVSCQLANLKVVTGEMGERRSRNANMTGKLKIEVSLFITRFYWHHISNTNLVNGSATPYGGFVVRPYLMEGLPFCPVHVSPPLLACLFFTVNAL